MPKGLKKGYKPSPAQLAQREKFKAMIQKKSAAKKTGSAAITAPAAAAQENEYGNALWIALGVILIAGVAYWYFTKDK